MGKSGKLFKTLAQGVRLFKSPSKDQSSKEQSPRFTKRQKQQSRESARQGLKDRCLWSLGRSSSRSNGENPVPSPSPPAADAVDIRVVHVEQTKHSSKADADLEDSYVETKSLTVDAVNSVPERSPKKDSTELAKEYAQEEWAAANIESGLQAYQSPHILEALIRIQALARGRIVRSQAAIALRCVQTIVRMQALVRGCLVRMSEDGQTVQKLLRARREASDGSLHAPQFQQSVSFYVDNKRLGSHQAMAHTFSEQIWKCAPKQSSMVIDLTRSEEHYWGWLWLQRWMVARPWESLFSLEGKHTLYMERDVDDRTRLEPTVEDVQTIFSHVNVEPDMEVTAQTTVLHAPPVEAANESLFQSGLTSASVTQDRMSQNLALEAPFVETSHTEDEISGHKVSIHDSGIHSTMVQIQTLQVSPPAPLPPEEVDLDLIPGPALLHPLPSDSSIPPPGDSAQLRPPSPVRESHQRLPAPTMEIAGDNEQFCNLESVAASQSSQVPDDVHMKNIDNLLVPDTASLPTFVVSEEDESQHKAFIPPCLQMPDGDDTANGLGVEVYVMPSTIGNNKENHTDEGQRKGPCLRKKGTEDTESIAQVKADGQSHMDGHCVVPNASCHKLVGVSNGRKLSNAVELEQMETSASVSPSLPNYMATTQSSKAKMRSTVSAGSPKQKSDSVKPKPESPSSSVPRRRHSLSALEGKSLQQRCTASHVCAGSKGQLASLRDGSIENSPRSNGGSRRHSHCK